jgi:phage recombination protein Bet
MSTDQTTGTALTVAEKKLPAAVEQRGITSEQWNVLTRQLYPAAKKSDTVLLAWDYCKARKLDPMKKPVHIVPFYNSDTGEMEEQILPGINELLVTAHRTGQFVGKDPTEFGPIRKFTFKGKNETAEIEAPEWAKATVYKLVNGVKYPFESDQIFFEECVALAKGVPNKIWRQRTRGQMGKCALAAALRVAFSEEVGSEPSAEEMEGQAFSYSSEETPVHKQVTALAIEKAIERAGIDSEIDDQVIDVDPTMQDTMEAVKEIAEQRGNSNGVKVANEVLAAANAEAEKITRAEGIGLNKFASEHGWPTSELVAHLAKTYSVREKYWTEDLKRSHLEETKAFLIANRREKK